MLAPEIFPICKYLGLRWIVRRPVRFKVAGQAIPMPRYVCCTSWVRAKSPCPADTGRLFIYLGHRVQTRKLCLKMSNETDVTHRKIVKTKLTF